MAHLLDNLLLQVPRQNEDVVGLGRVDRIHGQDRNMHPRRELAVLVRIAIDGEIEEVGSNPAIVEERIALAGSSISADSLAGLLDPDQERQEAALGLSYLVRKRSVGCDGAIAERLLAIQEIHYAPRHR